MKKWQEMRYTAAPGAAGRSMQSERMRPAAYSLFLDFGIRRVPEKFTAQLEQEGALRCALAIFSIARKKAS